MEANGYAIQETLRNDIIKTAKDRLYLERYKTQEAYDKERCLRGLAYLVIQGNDETLDNITSEKRLERLYSSLSINIEPYDDTRLLDLTTIDTALLDVLSYLEANCDQVYTDSFLKRINTARRSGLNPVKQDDNPFELLCRQNSVQIELS